MTQADSRVERVRSFFNVPDRYLRGRQYNIRIRRETVEEFLDGSRPESILDIGCGDGSLSIPLLTRGNRLTLLDLSSKMLAIARERIPAGLRDNVQIVNENFMAARLKEYAYDLILCVGVLAHVDDPPQVIAKLATLARPGASVIVELNDYHHFLSRVWRFHTKMRQIFRPEQYPLNRMSQETVLGAFAGHGFSLRGVYRYSIALPGMRRILTPNCLYRGIRAVYGTSRSNRNGWLGNEFVMHFKIAQMASL